MRLLRSLGPLAVLVLWACSPGAKEPLPDHSEHGRTTVDSVSVGRYKATLRLLPPNGDAADGGAATVMFRLDVDPDDPSSTPDIIMDEAATDEEYVAMVQQAAFGLHEDFHVFVDGRKVACSGSFMEQDVGVRKGKKFFLSFPVAYRDVVTAADVHVRWTDNLFLTGISIFRFTW